MMSSSRKVQRLRTSARRSQLPTVDLGYAVNLVLMAGHSEATSAQSIGTEAWETSIPILIREGLAATALSVLRASGDLVQARLLEVLTGAARMEVLRTLNVDSSSRGFLQEASRQGLGVCVIKGAALSEYYPTKLPRLYSDLDVIVDSSEFDASIKVAAQCGFRLEPSDEPARSSFARVCREGVNLHSELGNLDVHHHISPWIFGESLTARSLYHSGEDVPEFTSGTPIRRATIEDSAVICGVHVLNDLWKRHLGLKSVRDLVIIGDIIGPEALCQAFADRDRSWLLKMISERYGALLPMSALGRLSLDCKPPVGVRCRLAALGWNGPNPVSRSRVSWTARLPAWNGLSYLFGSLVPQRSWVHRHHDGYFKYWLKSLRTGRLSSSK